MSNNAMKNQKNVAGKFFCTDPDDSNGEGCIACNVCYSAAPEFFAEDENGNAYVHTQPKTADEVAICQEQLEACPVSSIGNDG